MADGASSVRFSGHATVRGILIGAIGSLIITTSSMYVALRMGALPWPTIFVAVMSMAILRLLRGTSLNEINVTHTAMSAGAMVAGGLAFTVPAVFILNPDAELSFGSVVVVSLVGAALGTVFTGLVRRYFIETNPLPFPMGAAAYETVTAGDTGGAKARVLFSTMGLAAVFTAIRDWLGLIPGAWMPAFLTKRNIFFGVWLSPMAVGIGYIIGPLYTGVWFLGALIAYGLIVPVAPLLGLFPDVATADAFRQSLGIGLMVGTGLGVLVKGILPKARQIYGSASSLSTGGRRRALWIVPIVFATFAAVLTVLTEMSLVPAIVTIVGVWITTSMAAVLTGQTGINPMEIFGILVLLAARLLWNTGTTEAILVAGVVAVACGLTGDVLNDFKSGHLLKTDPRAQVLAESVGGLLGAVVAALVLFVLYRSYGEFGGAALPAPQAKAVAAMVAGLPNMPAFYVGLGLGAVLYIANVPGMTLGLGIYLPMFISTAAFIGGAARFVVKRVKPKLDDQGVVLSSGLLGGEGIAGVTIAIVRVLVGG